MMIMKYKIIKIFMVIIDRSDFLKHRFYKHFKIMVALIIHSANLLIFKSYNKVQLELAGFLNQQRR